MYVASFPDRHAGRETIVPYIYIKQVHVYMYGYRNS